MYVELAEKYENEGQSSLENHMRNEARKSTIPREEKRKPTDVQKRRKLVAAFFIISSVAIFAGLFALGTWAFRESGKQKILSAGGDFHTTRARWEIAGFEQGKTWDGKPRWTTWRYDSDTEDWMVGWGLAVAGIGGMTAVTLLVLNKRRRRFSKNLS